MLIEGVIFIVITFLNIRDMILKCIPVNLRFAISAGIGMFIAFIGLKNAHIIVANPDTFVKLGNFTPECLLGIFSILISGMLMVRGVKGALFYGIILTTLVGIPLHVTQIPEGWLPVATPHSIAPVFCKFDFSQIFSLKMFMVIFSLLLINIFDTLGTLIGLAQKAGSSINGDMTNIKNAMLSDAVGTTASAFWVAVQSLLTSKVLRALPRVAAQVSPHSVWECYLSYPSSSHPYSCLFPLLPQVAHWSWWAC